MFLGRSGVSAVPLTWRVSARAYRLPNYERRDPGDRLLAGGRKTGVPAES